MRGPSPSPPPPAKSYNIPHIHDTQAPTLLRNDPNQNPFGTSESIQYDDEGAESKDAGANYGRLRDKLNEADVERRKIEEEAKNRERAAEMKREERLRKIAYMNEMPEDTPAGTGELSFCIARYVLACHSFCRYPRRLSTANE